MSDNEKIIGIDLGTSNSAACVYIDGKPTIVPSAEGATVYGKAFPSYVAFTEDGDLLVGEPAKKQAVSNPENTIKAIKREMGSNYKVEIQGKSYSPQQISGFILQKIKKDTEAFLGEKISKAVITVPAYFDDNQRTATKDAGTIAGLEVVRLLNEPTAASLAYGINKSTDEDVNILVFDMGGGTLDVTIMEFGGGIFEVQSTSGDTQLGGRDMDLVLKKYLADEFKNEHGVDLLNNDQSDMRLEEAAERAKIELSNTIETDVNLPFIAMGTDGKPLNLISTVNRSKLEALVEPIVKRCGETIQRALDDAVMKPEDIDKVILVGGPTRMPIVKKYVEDFMGKSVEGGIDPMECVAQGASIQAAVIIDDPGVKIPGGDTAGIILVDVTPLSLGTEVADGTTSVIIKRNTAIPIKKSEIYTTIHDNQTGVNVNVVQGERKMANDNAQLGSFLLEGIPPAPRGVPQIQITYEIDADGILNATAKELSTGVEQSIIIEASNKMSDEEIAKAIQDAKNFADADEKKAKLAKLKNDADTAIYKAEKLIYDRNYAHRIEASDKNNIEMLISDLRQAIVDENTIQLTAKTKELNNIISNVGTGLY